MPTSPTRGSPSKRGSRWQAERAPASSSRRPRMVIALAFVAWAGCGFWNSVKPLPPGTHVTSLPARLGDSQVEFIDDAARPGTLLRREIELIGRAEQIVVVDQSPVTQELSEQLLARKRQRPNLAIVLATDPSNQVYGGTAARTLQVLERAGIVVARTALDRMRDSKPIYSSFWRLTMGWWSNPFDERSDVATLTASLRRRNDKANRRQLLAADDGAGNWTSIVTSGPAALGGGSNAGIAIRGHLARDIVVSELQIADWSTGDDRLPAAPPHESRGVGTIDARLITEGAIGAALREVVRLAGSGDSIDLIARDLGDRALIETLQTAVARGARLRVLLDPGFLGTRAAAGELMENRPGNIEVRWQARAPAAARYALIRHRGDVWLDVGSADFTRQSLGDLNLEADVELHMPARAAPARAATDFFAAAWSHGAAYAEYADESMQTYWRYRLLQATGLSMF